MAGNPAEPRVNQAIRLLEVFLVDETGRSLGVVSIEEARRRASLAGLDLVEVNPTAQPPVVKVLDFGKYRYQQERQRSKQRKRAEGLKEIRLKIKTDEHDCQLKAKRASAFLDEGHKVKLTLIMRGREQMFKDLAIEKMKDFLALVSGSGQEAKFGLPPSHLGNRLTAIITKNGQKISGNDDKKETQDSQSGD